MHKEKTNSKTELWQIRIIEISVSLLLFALIILGVYLFLNTHLICISQFWIVLLIVLLVTFLVKIEKFIKANYP
jgi:hypothetical protein